MNIKYLLILLFIAIVTTVGGCSIANSPSISGTGTTTGSVSLSTGSYQTISAVKAKEMMDQNKDIIILDVRTEEEFNAGHIKDAILIPDTKIKASAESILTNKSAVILVYCRSGRRSAVAASALAAMGYTNVYDFGGIIDWNYGTVTE